MIFKKHISVFIAMLILVSNSGLAFSVHYCGGKIAAISSVFSKEEVCQMPIAVEKSCCAKPEVTHKNCCSDKKINIKSKAEQVIIKTISLDSQPAYFFEYKNLISAEVKVLFSSNENVAFYCQSNAPPLYKLYCQYTFYS